MKPIEFKAIGLTRSLSLIGLMVACSFAMVQAAPPPSSFGVWDRDGDFDAAEYPFLKGTVYNDSWKRIEKKPGVFDWSGLDAAVEKAVQNKMYLYLAVAAGPSSPDWIYEQGVPKVFTDDTKHENKWEYYPYYVSPAYKTYYERLITEFGKHIRSYPVEKQERIAFVQVKSGCTGDEVGYKGKPNESQYALDKSSAEWLAFRLWNFDLHVKTFQEGSGKPIDLLFNCVAANQRGDPVYMREWDWVTNHIKGGFGIKNGALSRGHHMSGERTLNNLWAPYLIDPKGLTLFRRSEMDGTWKGEFYQLNLPLNFYWGAINALNGGQSVWDVNKGSLTASKEGGYDYSFYFFNKYAGQIYPKTATDAFCALHKGLDGGDTLAYPESEFGKASPNNTDRMLKICERFAKYGASADDPDALNERASSGKAGFNDVGWDIWPDNYGRFLYQIDADATSIPLWRVGGPITPTSSIYSRFARGFEHASGKDTMLFKLHEGFSEGNEPKVMTMSVVWYDKTAGSTWKLDYDAGKEGMKTALNVTGKGDKQWHHERVTVEDAVLRQGGTKGADFTLVNTDDKDDIFSLIEVHRGKLEAPEATEKTPMTSEAGKAGKSGKVKKRKKNLSADGDGSE